MHNLHVLNKNVSPRTNSRKKSVATSHTPFSKTWRSMTGIKWKKHRYHDFGNGEFRKGTIKWNYRWNIKKNVTAIILALCPARGQDLTPYSISWANPFGTQAHTMHGHLVDLAVFSIWDPCIFSWLVGKMGKPRPFASQPDISCSPLKNCLGPNWDPNVTQKV